MNKVAGIIIAVTLLIAAGVWFGVIMPKTIENNNLREELAEKEQQQRKLEADLRETKRQITLLQKKDPGAVEAIARDKFGYCREGEEIYDIEMPKEDK
jgi:cell division protein FtsB